MGTVTISLSSILWILFVVVAGAGGFLVGRWVYSTVNDLKRLAAELVAALGGAEKVPGYMHGLVNVCEAQTQRYAELTAAIDRFTSVVVEPDGQVQPKDEVVQYDPGVADNNYRVSQLMAQGYSSDEAQVQVDIDDQKKILYPVSL